MPAKISTHVFKNMVRDVNPMSTNTSSLYNAYNIRFTSDDEQTFGSITNEKGTKYIDDVTISGSYLSHYVVNNCLMVFTLTPAIVEGYTTNIYRIELDGDTWTTTLVAQDIELNMDFDHPLEFTSYYEGEDVVKIYWVDGKNQLRFMNIQGDYSEATENDFNVLPKLNLQERIGVKQINGNGIFPSGVIQYAFTYINKLGAESNIFYVTKLKSIQYEDRAGHPQRTINCCFEITIENLDTSFDYVRCYQLIRTNLDEQPICKILNEVPVNKNDGGKVTIIDTNVGATYDATSLLFPKYPIIPYTLEQKSNTLFLGNIEEIPLELTDDDISAVRRYFNKYAVYPAPTIPGEPEQAPGYFPILKFDNLNQDTYECLDKDGYIVNTNADIIRTFKSRETYRIGVQLQDEYGCWTEPIYLKDINVTCKQKQEGIYITPISLTFDAGKAGVFPELSREFKRFRFLMVNPTAIDRETFDQGIVVPTMFEVSDRVDNIPFSYSSWYVRPQCGGIEFRHYLRTPNAVTDGTTGETIAANGSSFFSYTRPELPQTQTIADVNMVIDFKFNRIGGSSPSTTGRIHVIIPQCQLTSTQAQLVDGPISTQVAGIVHEAIVTFNNLNVMQDNTISDSQKLQVAQKFVEFLNKEKYSNTLYRHIADLYDEESEPKLSTMVYNKLLGQEIVVKGIENHGWLGDGTDNDGSATIEITLTFDDLDVTNYSVGPISVDNSMKWQTCNFHVDHSILNLYSPIINDDYYIVDNNRLDLNLIGYTNISKVNENVFVSMKTSGAGSNSCVENKNNIVDIRNIKLYNVNSKFLYYDTLVSQKISDQDAQIMQSYSNYIVGAANHHVAEVPYYVNYLVAPWHKPNFNNEDNTYGDIRSAVYERKVFGRMFTTNSAHYFNNPLLSSNKDTYEAIPLEEYQTPDVLKICNNTTSLKTFMQDNVLRTYLPNVDIARTFSREGYSIPVLNNSDNTVTTVYGIDVIAKANKPSEPDFDYTKVHIKDDTYEGILTASDPIQIKYVSDAHVLIPFNRQIIQVGENQTNCRCLFRLPNLSSQELTYSHTIPQYGRGSAGSVNPGEAPVNPYYPNWDKYNMYVDYDCYIYDDNERVITESPYVFIGELHREVLNKYGGSIDISDIPPADPDEPYCYDRNDSVLTSNIYIPISESISIETLSGIQKISTTYGDTWYGRWDCLKTQEMTADDQQSVHDYISVMIESHMNLNGRYDEYRNYSDWTVVTAELANKFNPVYNQMDNFWNYRVIPAYIKSFVRPNQITWSLTKQSGSLVDEWTKVTEAAVFEMDGTKGKINRIVNYKDNLIVFQDKCLSQLLYNEQMQMTTTEGVPVEISNSEKVTGRRVLFDNTGCVNKWSICSTQDALFFIDNYNKGIFAYTPESKEGPITNITNSFGFDTFMKKENSLDVWNPESFSNFVTFQDSLRKDVYFINNNNCLAYSSLINGFTSFYSYEETPAMFNYKGKFFSIKNNRLYEMFADKYNHIYEQIQPSILEFIDTGQTNDQDGGSIFADKTFTNISYLQDAFSVNSTDEISEDYIGKNYTYLPERTFNSIRVHTPFQDTGVVDLHVQRDVITNLQRKFRTWNIQIPRCRSTMFDSDSLDRIRNNWARFTLNFQPNNNENTKIELFGINVYNII